MPGHGGTEEGNFNLPGDYYKAVPTWISLLWIPFQWIVLPVLSYNPDLFDPLLNDHYQAIADGQKHNIIKLFNILLWVSPMTRTAHAQKMTTTTYSTDFLLGLGKKTTSYFTKSCRC